MRVVLDTNVLISAFLFGGRLQFLIDLLQHGNIAPCFSNRTWKEFVRVLQYPHLVRILHKHQVDGAELLIRLKTQVLLFPDTLSSVVIPQDHADEAILACAVAAKVNAVITGDRHLLALAKSFPISIMTPQEFKKWFLAQRKV